MLKTDFDTLDYKLHQEEKTGEYFCAVSSPCQWWTWDVGGAGAKKIKRAPAHRKSSYLYSEIVTTMVKIQMSYYVIITSTHGELFDWALYHVLSTIGASERALDYQCSLCC